MANHHGPPPEPPDPSARLAQQGHTVFMAEEARRWLHPIDAITTQVQMIAKRWWVLQAVLLTVAWVLLQSETDVLAVRRMLAVIGALFGILVIPELWKNERTNSIEVEMTAMYSLRYIYAIRLLVFAVADVCLLTLFSALTVLTNQMALIDVVIQLLLPISITAAICVGLLGRPRVTERQAILACLGWNALWAMVITNDWLYGHLASPLLVGLLGGVVIVGLWLTYRVLTGADQIVEGVGYAAHA